MDSQPWNFEAKSLIPRDNSPPSLVNNTVGTFVSLFGSDTNCNAAGDVGTATSFNNPRFNDCMSSDGNSFVAVSTDAAFTCDGERFPAMYYWTNSASCDPTLDIQILDILTIPQNTGGGNCLLRFDNDPAMSVKIGCAAVDLTDIF
ncbi:hypothetical protein LTR56_018468 [Elasticomyces elasticus]|nr:hypothetical protein LTR56_018468 [Elasticomyces elasticus]KAK3632658.1 hypothetical protein LTR22_020472 [Elasticomyces elasticus]KAK4912198.1 hypothetical protein LTR49_019294 [Elasticomyces elasticus]KAK5769359.1 hypothetical protein LTS12_000286 [Elasticomyces elasticus]